MNTYFSGLIWIWDALAKGVVWHEIEAWRHQLIKFLGYEKARLSIWQNSLGRQKTDAYPLFYQCGAYSNNNCVWIACRVICEKFAAAWIVWCCFKNHKGCWVCRLSRNKISIRQHGKNIRLFLSLFLFGRSREKSRNIPNSLRTIFPQRRNSRRNLVGNKNYVLLRLRQDLRSIHAESRRIEHFSKLFRVIFGFAVVIPDNDGKCNFGNMTI